VTEFVAEVVESVVHSVVQDIEAGKKASLGPKERADVAEFVRMVLASGLDVAELEADE
jgi:hypothetical protein